MLFFPISGIKSFISTLSNMENIKFIEICYIFRLWELFSNSMHSLVVEWSVAIALTRVRLPVHAFFAIYTNINYFDKVN